MEEDKIFLIADTHFGDRYILDFENRPFESVEHMDAYMTDNWNKTVNDNDIVYVLGDFGNTLNAAQLKGRKHLIKGNHDTQSNEFYRSQGFLEVYDKPVLLESFWLLSHEPLYVSARSPYVNIFGHVHGSPIYRGYSECHFCVSVERIAYTPIPFEEIHRTVIRKRAEDI